MNSTEKKDPVIGIAFGGGGIRGFAHLAVMEKFKDYNIKADMVSGTSIGSGIAAMYAAGRYGKDVSDELFDVDMKKLFTLSGKGGFVSGARYAKTFVDKIGVKTFEELPIPVKIISTDLIHWQPYVHDSGSLALAIQASSALPGAFSPVTCGDLLLSDGGTVDNCPAGILREMGADIVIAIDLDYRSHTKPKNVVEIVQRAMDIMISNGRRAEQADVVIKPFDKYVAALALTKAELCYELGQTAIEEKMPEILAVLKQWYDEKNLPYPEYLQETASAQSALSE
ncbi:MAG: patatin-like phospholipase family protein [Bacillota bacterium]|jgi:NTE family protein